MMRNTLLCLVLVPALGVAAQQPTQPAPAAGSNWQHVQALPVGASIQVQARKSHANCKLKSVDADTLTCTNKKDVVFERTDILSIRIPRHALSTAILAGVGAGVGVGVVAATSNSLGFGGYAHQGVYPGGAGIGAALFGTVGYLTDFAKSTVYKAQ